MNILSETIYHYRELLTLRLTRGAPFEFSDTFASFNDVMRIYGEIHAVKFVR